MSRSKKRIYGTAVLVAAVGLAVDRWVIGPPAGTLAGEMAESMTTEGAPDSIVLRRHEALKVVFPADLPAVDWGRPPRDPFRLPPAIALRQDLRLSGGRVTTPQQQVRRPGEPPSVAEFVATHRLNGVFVGNLARAIVDGGIVEVGQSLDHARLLEVRGNQAHFQCADGVAVLRVESTP